MSEDLHVHVYCIDPECLWHTLFFYCSSTLCISKTRPRIEFCKASVINVYVHHNIAGKALYVSDFVPKWLMTQLYSELTMSQKKR